MSEAKKLKTTVRLPKTDFAMRANLPNREPGFLEQWQAMDLYGMIQKARSADNAGTFTLHDGPPYANADIHIGTALNKILKDIVVRSRNMLGMHAPYVPGWDCHGLPIEQAVEKKVGRQKRIDDPSGFRVDCREFARSFIQRQMDEFKRLGVMGDWENRYETLDYGYEVTIADSLVEFCEKGLVYRGKKPVQWCLSCRTALAEAEVEYADRTDPSVFVAFPAKTDLGDKFEALKGKNVSAVIWTTTPWTLPANRAICLHPELDYRFVNTDKGVYLLVKDLADAFFEKTGLSAGEVLVECKGADLEGVIFAHPWLDRESPIVLGDYVTTETGTGLVHTAPGHGADDFYTGVKYDLPLDAPVDAGGRFTEEAGEELMGKMVFDANPEIVERMKNDGSLILHEDYPHSYPHCWRCKKALIFRATEQWFASMEQGEIRNKALQQIESIGEQGGWVPPWGQQRIQSMIAGRPDWCLSRQRVWGVPILAFHCEDCGKSHVKREWADPLLKRAEKEGFDFWFSGDHSGLLPEAAACDCGSENLVKETDILDVWFDSGVSHLAVLEKRGMSWPADLYLEGSDQHRGWFHTSLLTGVALRDKAPYKNVLTHGFVVAGDGRKMSKSLGNVISPLKVIKADGAEILRLWSSMVDYRDDVRISPDILAQNRETYRKIRNTMRFLLGNLDGFDPAADQVAYEDMDELDRWALQTTRAMAQRVEKAYREFALYRIYHELNDFCTVTLSAFYLDILKDRLYIGAGDDPKRLSSRAAMARIARVLSTLMAPVLPFTAEDVWQHLPGYQEGSSVHMEMLDLLEDVPEDDGLLDTFKALGAIRDTANKALEEARAEGVVGSSLKAHLKVTGQDELFAERFAADPDYLRDLLIVSKLSFEPGEGELTFSVEEAPGEKCERCWHIEDNVAAREDLPFEPNVVCDRCYGVLSPAPVDA